MFLLAEAAVVRLSRRAVAVASVLVGSVGVSACSSYRLDHAPVSIATAASAPVVVVAAPSVPVMDAASAPITVTAAPVDPVLPGDLASRRLLAHHDVLRTLSPNELAQEINRLAALSAAPDSALELALALLQTRNGGELNRAIGLVEPISKNGATEHRPWQPFARLLLSRLLELRRLEDLLDRRNLELRDSQREVKQLNEKLEALKAIERSLAPRSSSVVPPAAPSGSASLAPASPPTATPRRAP